MKPEQQRITIAEACGWVRREPFLNALGYETQEWEKKSVVNEHYCSGHTLRELPDYPNDLNACHEFERWIRLKDRAMYWTYGKKLDGVVARYNDKDNKDQNDCIGIFEATAEQRCEAFLRVLGKWEEAT